MSETSSSAPNEPAAFQPVAFGKYFLVDKIAAGGMAEIFKAKTFSHGGFENLVVIKRILPHIGDNPDFVEMFQDEARVSVQLQHPNIVRIYDFGKIQQNWFIVMECVDGKDVRFLLRAGSRRKQFMPPELCAYIALEVCKGLHYAHAKTDLEGNPFGIVHRDISPSNVLLSYEGEVKIADFGIAKAESNAYQTRDGMLKGKFEYMSPEQAQGSEIDHRSDLFSLGIILWETMTGRRLFRTDSETATLNKVREADVTPPETLRPDLPERLASICMKALTRDRDIRYASAADLESDLRDFLFPETSDTLKAKMRAYLQESFAEEIASERTRLQQGETLARKLKDTLPPADWEGTQGETLSHVTQTAVQAVVPWIAGASVGLFVLGGLTLAAIVYFVWTQPPPNAPPNGVIVTQPAERTILDVTVFPAARVLVDGVEKGNGTSVMLEDMAPGTYTVRLEAEGYEPLEESVNVEQGRIVKVVKQLAAIPVATPDPQPTEPVPTQAPEPTGPPELDIRSSPSGAAVLLDGKQICTTPCTWSKVSVGDAVNIDLRLDGYETAKTGVRSVKPGTNRISSNLKPVASPPLLTVTLLGGGWANIYVDGEKLPKTAPFKELQVPAGPHEIRAANPTTGLDLTERHTFEPGKTTTLRFNTQQ
ncbi:MAG: protein kinase [Alphaproteobacteria bacterium]|nr:protein kinase [Alphaproteobacteria bacterium]